MVDLQFEVSQLIDIMRFSFSNSDRPENAREYFNLKHSSLRNVIERIFGVLKKRFVALNTMDLHGYSYEFQVQFVQVVMALHNFIRKHDKDDILVLDDDDESYHETPVLIQGDRGDIASDFRDKLANKMWRQHLTYRNEIQCFA